MKFRFLFFLLAGFTGAVYCQQYAAVFVQIPISATYSGTSIAAYISANFKTDNEKIQAAYGWVTANIIYDKDSMYNINWGPDASLKVSAALRRKKGVCENFASIFTDILLKSGIPSFVVNGYTTYSNTGHSWSAVWLDKEWRLCDPTWDIGIGQTNYFMVSPEVFIDTHFPFDPLWQLLPYPHIKYPVNKRIPATAKWNLPWNINDSVNAFLKLDSLHQLEAAQVRMNLAGEQINTLQTWKAYTNMKIAIVYGDIDKALYNAAVDDLNKASLIFNNFVNYRNNKFLPTKPDNVLKGLLESIPEIIASANQRINKIGQIVVNDQYDTGSIKQRLSNLIKRVLEQQDFLNEYLQTNTEFRNKLFYK